MVDKSNVTPSLVTRPKPLTWRYHQDIFAFSHSINCLIVTKGDIPQDLERGLSPLNVFVLVVLTCDYLCTATNCCLLWIEALQGTMCVFVCVLVIYVFGMCVHLICVCVLPMCLCVFTGVCASVCVIVGEQT